MSQQLTPTHSCPDEIETETQWVTDNVRNGLTGISLSVFAIAIFCWALFPFLFPDTKKTDHRVINTSLFALVMLAGAGCVAAGVVVSHDEPIYFMKQQKRRTLTAYQFGVSEEIQKDQIMAAVLPQMPALPPAESVAQPQLKTEEPEQGEQEEAIEPFPMSASFGTDFYNWNNLADEASGILVGGNSGSAKTSLGAGFIVGKLTASKPAEVIVLDIHASKNPLWQQMGFPRIESDVETIYQILCWFVEEVETRKGRDGHQIIICLDEINDTLSELQQLDITDPLPGKEKRTKTFSYAIRKLSNARKFDICLIGFMQSHNTEAIGIDGKFRNNFLLVLCGASARSEVSNLWKHDDPRFLYIQSTAYPVVISGSNPVEIAQHPTHKHHAIYRKKGNAPANLIQPKFLTETSIPTFASKEIDLKKPELPQIKSDNPGGEIGNIDSWLRVPFPEKLNLLPAHRPGLYALIIDGQVTYIGQTSNLYRRLNIDDHAKIPAMHAAKKKGLKTEVAYFSTNLSKEDRSKWEERLYRDYDCDWNGRSRLIIPESINEKLDRQDDAIYQFCLQFDEPVKARDVQRNNQLKQEFNLDSEKVKKSFERLQLMKLGVISIERVGGSDSWRFTPKI